MLSRVRAVSRTIAYNRDWARYFWARARTSSDGVILTYRLRNGQVVKLRGSLRATLNEIYLHRVYDVPGVDWRDCRHVLDCGANMGLFALYVASRSPRASIDCFEPSSENHALLLENLSRNHTRAVAHRLAVGATSGSRRLCVSGPAGMYSLDGSGERSEQVECIDVKRMLDLSGAETSDFMKMDIEGEELSLLMDTPLDTLRRIRAMSMEWHHPTPELTVARARLDRAGFETMVDVVGHAQRQLMLKARLRS